MSTSEGVRILASEKLERVMRWAVVTAIELAPEYRIADVIRTIEAQELVSKWHIFTSDYREELCESERCLR